jgi:hypothetical protein
MFPLQEKRVLEVDKDFMIDRFLQQPVSDESILAPEVYNDLEVVLASQETDNEDDDDNSDDGEDETESGSYRDFIMNSSAYSWLVATLQRETILIRANPDLMKKIEEKILSALPSAHKVSMKARPQTYKVTFELEWDPLSFVKEQKYRESPEQALQNAITLTGGENDAQAVTASEYLFQTWPATGRHVMRLVTDVVRSTKKYHATCKRIIPLLLFLIVPDLA